MRRRPVLGGLLTGALLLVVVGSVVADDSAPPDVDVAPSIELEVVDEPAPEPAPEPAIEPDGAAAPDAVEAPAPAGPMTLQERIASKEREPVSFGARLQSLFGIGILLGIAWLLSNDRRKLPWRVILWGLGLQFTFAFLVLKTEGGNALFSFLNDVVMTLLGYTEEGARFVFGGLVGSELTLEYKPQGDPFAQGEPVAIVTGGEAAGDY